MVVIWWRAADELVFDNVVNYSDCDSAADSYTLSGVLTWQSAVLVIMTGLGQGSAIGAYREQAQRMQRSHDASGSIQMNIHLTRRAAGINSLRTPADAAGRQVGNGWFSRHYY